jgi:NAD(P)-dependent dehydrogenase (short-subunit alcohol dehydrogenase family)
MEDNMDIKGCVALVTGANRGLGSAYAEALLAAGASKVYAGARDPSGIANPRLTPVRLDITSAGDVAASAETCDDVDVLINNAGAMLLSPVLADGAESALRREMEVNVFGLHAMLRAFAPILARNGGGTIANMLSVVSWYVYPFNATYCASKHAALALTNAARIELKAQGTHVVGVYAGFIDTDMASFVNQPKTSPRQVAERTLDGIKMGEDHVFADRRAEEVWQAVRENPAELAARMQLLWDARAASAGRANSPL